MREVDLDSVRGWGGGGRKRDGMGRERGGEGERGGDGEVVRRERGRRWGGKGRRREWRGGDGEGVRRERGRRWGGKGRRERGGETNIKSTPALTTGMQYLVSQQVWNWWYQMVKTILRCSAVSYPVPDTPPPSC